MKHPILLRLAFLLRAIVVLLSVFTLWRVLFFCFNTSSIEYPAHVVYPAFLLGIRMDAAVIAYLLAPLFLLLFFIDFTAKRSVVFIAILWTISTLLTVVTVGNLVIYHYWGTLLNYRAINYLKDPAEAAASASPVQLALLFSLAVLAILATGMLLTKSLKPGKTGEMNAIHQRGVVLLIWLVFILTAARGGWQQLPLNESNVYYSNHAFLNHSAVNPVWHLINDIKMAGVTNENPYRKMSDSQADSVVATLHSKQLDSASNILTTIRPNIVMIIMESFTAHVVGAMGGETGLTPCMDSAIHSGLSFSNIYASGFRTDQGIVSVLNGWPATPYHSIMRSTDKSEHLPSIPKLLKAKGYRTSFYYGGAPNFSNLGAYLNTQEFDRIVTAESFSESQSHGQWGYHDEVVLSRQIQDVNKDSTPFLSVVMTLSNHEPFDVPGKPINNLKTDADKFRNSAHYTDDALRAYFEKARSAPWFSNTLFILVADHGHSLPDNISISYPSSRWIPMVFTGPAVSPMYQNKRINTMGGHHDLAATLLPELGIEPQSFRWSKNIMSPRSVSYAFIPFESMVLWNLPDGWFFYSYDRKMVTERSFTGKQKESDEQIRQALAMMQAHYGAYLAY